MAHDPSNTQRTLTVGLLGLGVVGSGVATLLRDHADEIAGRVGARLEIGPVVVRGGAATLKCRRILKRFQILGRGSACAIKP